ncbi:MAG: hypothetical protein ABI430_04520 [Candidatus Taylorbacteria bacterium]
MADINKSRADAKWWQEELSIREGKVGEAKRMVEQRERELETAEREERNQKKGA